jgi:signal transduction histidine kinase
LLLNSFDFQSNHIANILYDEQSQTLWLGSKINGLYLFEPKRFKSINSDLHQHTDENYYAQTPVSDSSVYTPQGYILGLKSKSSKALPFKNLSPDKYALLTDKDGFVWMNFEHQLIRADPKFNVISKWQILDEATTLLEGTGNWIYAGRREKGLIRIRKNSTDGRFEFVSNRIKNISYLAQQSADILLIGASDGLYKYNLKTKKIDTVAGFKNKAIRSLYCPEPYDKIWVTTYGDGFYLVADGKVTAFPLDKDNYLATSHCMIEDSRGYFWITTNKGLFQASKKDLLAYAAKKSSDVYYAYYSRDNGFNTNEFNGGCQPCAVKLANGNISLPSLNGLVFFKPEEILINPNDSKIFIDEIKVDNDTVPASQAIILQHGFSLLQISISSSYLNNRKNVQLQYTLSKEAGKDLWFPVGDNGVISISNPGSGTHTLIIRKPSGFGGAYISKTVQLTVLPAWYETWLVRAMAVLLMVLLAIIFNRWRIRNLVRQNLFLENQIEAKTQVLKVTLDNLQNAQSNLLRQMFLLERLVGAITHNIRTPLIFLNRSAEFLHQKHELENVSPGLLKIGRNNWDFSTRLLNLANNLLEFIKSWLAKDNSQPELFNLHDLVQEKISIFIAIAQEKNTIIRNEIRHDLMVESIRGMISVIFYNLLDNALKATKKGTILVSAENVNDRLHILVHNSGKGMEPEIVNWVNNFTDGTEKLYRGSERPVHSGIGLVLSIELAGLMGLEIFAESTVKSGTTMMIIFPKTQPASPPEPILSLT